jgi:hypothetical protein
MLNRKLEAYATTDRKLEAYATRDRKLEAYATRVLLRSLSGNVDQK